LTDAPGVELLSAYAINDQGVIVGSAHAAGDDQAFILTPIDPPFTDLDGDCQTGVTDLVRVIVDWGKIDSPADLSGDGVVGLEDLLLIVMNWG
jgi:hypothetical protein